MTTILHTTACFCAAALLLGGCATTGGGMMRPSHGQGEMMTGQLDPSGFYEACDDMEPGQKVRYHFTASGPVNFNVHYHAADGKSYPVKQDNITSLEGEFQVDAKATYCCLWQNLTATAVDISYQFSKKTE